MPSPAPGSVTARTHSTSITTNSVAIIHLVMRSTPFCKPMPHTTAPTTTATTIHAISPTGSASMPENTAAVVWTSAPLNTPDAIFGT